MLSLLSRGVLLASAVGCLETAAVSSNEVAGSCDAGAVAGGTAASPELKEGEGEGEASSREERVTSSKQAGILDWMRGCGGFLHDKVRVLDDSSRVVVTTQTLKATDVILSLPYGCLLVSDTPCELVQKLEKMMMGPEEYDGVWIVEEEEEEDNYTNATTAGYDGSSSSNNNNNNANNAGQRLAPHLWSMEGQELLQQVHDFSLSTFISFPSIQKETRDDACPSSVTMNDTVNRILERDTQRLSDGKWGLVPSFLKATTTDPTIANARLNLYKNLVQLVALKTVPPGQIVALRKNEDWSVPEMVRELGVVPAFPRKWTFDWENEDERDTVSFVMDHHNGPYAKPGGDPLLELKWMSGKKDDDIPNKTREELRQTWKTHLARLYSMDLTSDNNIPSPELAVIQEYHQALIVAMESLNELFDGGTVGWCEYPQEDEEEEEEEEKQLTQQREQLVKTCFVPKSRYSALGLPFDDYHRAACDERAEVDFISQNFDEIDKVESPYQDIVYIQHEETGNLCFELDSIYQICSSYRPHYHEMVVHYTARFLPDIRRVVWIGGGDAMLLHEILKYPNLERVIGLELDQQVTRMAFKHFGVQPHYDDPRVQWWYGDAAKSLLMLPAEYFGTFDMVLVDLSETVMSFLVSDELDILTALSLLLKPEGIFVKNEMYFEKLKQIFPHSVQLKYDDVPLICKQCLALGSFGTNFLEANLTNHPVETLFDPLDELDSDWQEVHSYHWNPSAQKHCMSGNNNYTNTKQDNSPGLVLIIEAEDANPLVLKSSKALEKALLGVLRTQVPALNVITSLTPSDNDEAVIIMMQEGYVVGRAWEEFEYCALDVHLWSSFNQLEAIEQALLSALGSSSSSSFRIVSGGMYGTSTWKEDVASRGPQFDPECGTREGEEDNRDLSSAEVASAETNNLMAVVLEENLAMWIPKEEQEDTNALVICGLETNPCQALDFVRTASLRSVTPIWTCAAIVESEKDMFACETKVLSILKEAAVEEIDFFVFDVNADKTMAQIVHKILSSKEHRAAFFSTKQDSMVVMAPGSDPENQPWRQVFVSQFASFFPHEPGFWSQVTFDDKQEINLFILGDKYFIRHLDQVNARIEKRSGGGIKGIRGHVGGVEFKYYEDFEASKFFDHDDYDQNAPLEQWSFQEPVGYQILFQLLAEKNTTLSKALVVKMLDDALDGTDVERTLEPQVFDNLGDGSVTVAGFSSDEVAGGTVICTWDGRDHLDVNIFTYVESEDFANEFLTKLTDQNLKIVLRDEMPRGYGRVVNFESDLQDPRQHPYWAEHLEPIM